MDTEHEKTEQEDCGSDGTSLHRANFQQARVTRLERLRSCGESSVMGTVIHKVCCQCGSELNHRTRFKDSQGRYWCPECNDIDRKKVLPTPCADCHLDLPRSDLVEYRGRLLCPVCIEQHRYDEKQATLEVKNHPEMALDPVHQFQNASIWPFLLGLVVVASCVGGLAYLVLK